MPIELKAAFSNYLDVVEERFKEARADTGVPQRLRLLLSDKQLLLRIVQDLEGTKELSGTKEFTDLVRAIARHCQNGDAEQGVSGIWEGHVKNFLRLSSLYQRLFAGETTRPDDVTGQCKAAFSARSHKVIHLAPLEFVAFSNDRVDCGAFTIRKFSRQDLDGVLRNAVKKVFYEWAYVDSRELDEYWFVWVEEQVKAREPGKVILYLDPFVRAHRSPFRFPVLERMGYGPPRSFQEALENLALYNWAAAIKGQAGDYEKWPERWQGPFLPHVPFVISISDSLIDRPATTPDLSALEKERVQDPTTGDYFCRPRRNLTFSEDETRAFESSMQRIACLRAKLQQYSAPWRFAQTALGFLVKGFTAEDIEQLLWHITAIEAALGGDRRLGFSKRLATRVSKVFGTEKDRVEHRRQFDQLYQYRCDLVHGNVELQDKTIARSHLSEARNFARGAVLWTLRYLHHVAENLPAGPRAVPSRETLLQVLDMESETRQPLPSVLGAVPPDFPHIEGWLECE